MKHYTSYVCFFFFPNCLKMQKPILSRQATGKGGVGWTWRPATLGAAVCPPRHRGHAVPSARPQRHKNVSILLSPSVSARNEPAPCDDVRPTGAPPAATSAESTRPWPPGPCELPAPPPPRPQPSGLSSTFALFIALHKFVSAANLQRALLV